MVVYSGAQIQMNATILLFPFLILEMAILGLGLGLIFSSLTTKYRDLVFLLQFSIQLLMYATPVIYPLSYTEGKLRQFLELNPLTSIIETFRYCFFSVGDLNWAGLVYSGTFSVVILLLGIFIFNKVEKNFMDTV
jgi:lipopolysaccharide transport system permease protein